MNNADMPVMAIVDDNGVYVESGIPAIGLTKREQVCLTMGVADIGDAERDAIITKGNKQKLAGLAMQGLLAQSYVPRSVKEVAFESLAMADALLKALEQDNE
jgi:hypothetical protein